MKTPETREIIEVGSAYERNGQWIEAEAQWRLLMSDSAMLFWGQMRLGGVLFAQSRFDEAIAILESALALNPLHPYAQDILLRSKIQAAGFIDDTSFLDTSKLTELEYSGVLSLIERIERLKRRGVSRSLFSHDIYTLIDFDTPIFDVSEHDGSIPAILDTGAHSICLAGNWDLLGRRFEEFEVYRAINSVLFAKSISWKETDFYRSNVNKILTGNFVWNCDTVADFDRRLEEYMPALLEKISSHGLLRQSQIGGWDPMDDIRLGVGRNGDLIFLNGQHRLAIAKLLKLRRFPVRIVLRHSLWETLRSEIEEYRCMTGRGFIYQQLPHPDLINVAAVHKLERLDTIVDYVRKENLFSGHVLDIGSHWGAASITFSNAGFNCTAVENNAEFLPYLQKLTSFSNSKIRVLNSNIFDLIDLSTFNVVLALNILHHFLRTEPSFVALKSLLRRIPHCHMFVQTHNPDTVDNIDDYFAPMTVYEFLDFILDNTVFTSFREIYRESDGRPIFAFQ
jgi:hypothetical protein